MAVTAEDLLLQMEGKMTVPFVHGRGKRKSQLQRDIEEMRKLLDRKEKIPAIRKHLVTETASPKQILTQPSCT